MYAFLVLFLGLANMVWADGDSGSLDPGEGLAMQFFCQASTVLEGNIGLLLGFLVAAYGLWIIIQGSLKLGILAIIAGALLTALPGIILSTFGGISTLLMQNQVSSFNVTTYANYVRGMRNNCGAISGMIDWTTYNAEQERRGSPSYQAEREAIRSGSYAGGSVPANTPVADDTPGTPPGSCAGLIDGPSTKRSGYGMRVHPVTGVRRLHAGIDLAAAGGKPIKAAAGGTVIEARYSGGAGNKTVIDHGGGKTTVYMHQSSFNKTSGAIGAGQIVGYVGTTGLSTGNHLHFEIRQNGTPTDPAPKGCIP